MQWPGDSDGDVFRRLQASGFDFSANFTVDYNVDFSSWPPHPEAMALLSKMFGSVTVYDPEQESEGYVLIQEHGPVTYLEGRQAALFCYGIGQILGTEVSFAQVEREDYDIVTRRIVGDELVYSAVQLKEWVPNRIRTLSSLKHEIDKLKKYVDARELVVAFCLNREARIELKQLNLPVGIIGELWFFGAASPDQNTWHLLGDLLSPSAHAHEFTYPAPA